MLTQNVRQKESPPTNQNRSKIGDFAAMRSVLTKISGRRGRPPPIIFALISTSHHHSSCRTSLASNSPAHHLQDSSSGVEMSTRQKSAALPCRSVHSGHFSRGKASITLCNDWNPSLAQSSDFHWPAKLRSVRARNLEQSIPPSLRAPNCR